MQTFFFLNVKPGAQFTLKQFQFCQETTDINRSCPTDSEEIFCFKYSCDFSLLNGFPCVNEHTFRAGYCQC